MRHADAAAPPPGGSDGDRALTPRGRGETREAARSFRTRVARLDGIYTSPLVRAVQTAELLAAELGHEGTVDARVELASGVRPEAMFRAVPRGGQAALLVGHEPTISALAAWLMDREVGSFAKAAIFGVDLPSGDPPGKFEFLIQPGAEVKLALP